MPRGPGRRLTAPARTTAGPLKALVFAPLQPRGLVVGLHANPMKPEALERWTGLGAAGSAVNLAVALLRAPRSSPRGPVWDVDADVEPVAEAVIDLTRRFTAGGRLPVVCGLSAGAKVACRVASRHPGLVAALGAVAGLQPPDDGPLAPHLRVLAFHGTDDRVAPFVSSSGAGAVEAARCWARRLGTAYQETTEMLSPTAIVHHFGTPGSRQVTLWELAGGGHTWPGGDPGGWLRRRLLGKTVVEVSATSQILMSGGGLDA